jgi:hypothetical protein
MVFARCINETGLDTTTTGRRSKGSPPGPLLEIAALGLLTPPGLPFAGAVERSRFISDTFFTFFSCTYISQNNLQTHKKLK